MLVAHDIDKQGFSNKGCWLLEAMVHILVP